MSGFSDCSKNTIPVFCEAQVENCSGVEGAFPSGSVFSLTVQFSANEDSVPSPGQFFMLRAKHSQVLLARPISVFNVIPNTPMGYIKVEFLILKKGQGTSELCALKKGDLIEMLGPCGNIFPSPKKEERVCIAGGGIGIAPVAGFAKTCRQNPMTFTRVSKADLTESKTFRRKILSSPLTTARAEFAE